MDFLSIITGNFEHSTSRCDRKGDRIGKEKGPSAEMLWRNIDEVSDIVNRGAT